MGLIVRDRTPGNMLHCPAINWSPSHVVEGQRCVNVVDRIQDLESKETAKGVKKRHLIKVEVVLQLYSLTFLPIISFPRDKNY